MEQIENMFVPHMLVVETGTQVSFPNNDSVSHHVYSFSGENRFTLPIYKGDPHPPVTFEHDGIVVLGCNIHDDMLAYIVVVDSDSFGKTDSDGVVLLTAEEPSGVSVRAWSPRIADGDGHLVQSVVEHKESLTVTFQLTRKLRPEHDSAEPGLAWTDY